MPRSSSTRRVAFSAGFTLFVAAALLGCPKKAPAPMPDAAEPPPPASTTVTELAPLTDDDAGDGGDGGDGGAKHWTGGGGAGPNQNQVKIAQCCAAMRSQAKQMNGSPEAFQLNAMAAQCDTFAKQVGPAGNAPEMNQARAVLRSIKLPKGCEF